MSSTRPTSRRSGHFCDPRNSHPLRHPGHHLQDRREQSRRANSFSNRLGWSHLLLRASRLLRARNRSWRSGYYSHRARLRRHYRTCTRNAAAPAFRRLHDDGRDQSRAFVDRSPRSRSYRHPRQSQDLISVVSAVLCVLCVRRTHSTQRPQRAAETRRVLCS